MKRKIKTNNAYPFPALFFDRAANLDITDIGCPIGHSLAKWAGYRDDYEHTMELVKAESEPYEVDSVIASQTCSLCQRYFHHDCERCPLAIVRGYADNQRKFTPCDVYLPTEGDSPWYTWTSKHNPLPMISWLIKAQNHFVVASIHAPELPLVLP